MVIPLPSDTEFFQLLTSTLSTLADRCDTLQDDFNSALASLATSISSTARPASSSAPRSFSAYSSTASNVVSLVPSRGGKSDLYTWREMFQLYAEVEVFESVKESTRGERSIEEVEKQFKLFKGRVQAKKASLMLPGSKDAFDAFLKLNWFILNVKKVSMRFCLALLEQLTHRNTASIREFGSDTKDPQEAYQTYDASGPVLSFGVQPVYLRVYLLASSLVDHPSFEILTKTSRASHRRGSFAGHTTCR